MEVVFILKLIKGERVSDGAGVKLNRTMAIEALDYADPFFLLDEFKSNDKNDYIAGFPMHPHRGIETITYMIEGNFIHRDSKGNEDHLTAGEVKWMIAGKGILQEEMPAMEDGQLWGYQLWINLPSKYKMTEPKYRHLKKEEMPVVKKDGFEVKIISGLYDGQEGPVKSYFPVDYMDVRLKDGSFIKDELKGTNLVYVHTGSVKVISEDEQLEIQAGNLCLIEDSSMLKAEGKEAGFLFLSAAPLKEPVARYGPYVMNTMDEILQTIDDFNEELSDK